MSRTIFNQILLIFFIKLRINPILCPLIISLIKTNILILQKKTNILIVLVFFLEIF